MGACRCASPIRPRDPLLTKFGSFISITVYRIVININAGQNLFLVFIFSLSFLVEHLRRSSWPLIHIRRRLLTVLAPLRRRLFRSLLGVSITRPFTGFERLLLLNLNEVLIRASFIGQHRVPLSIEVDPLVVFDSGDLRHREGSIP